MELKEVDANNIQDRNAAQNIRKHQLAQKQHFWHKSQSSV